MLVLCAYLKSIAHHACRAFLKQKGINLKKWLQQEFYK